MNWQDAHRLAMRIEAAIFDGCIDIQIAGSLRRRKPEVRDIEICAIPRPYEGLFGGGGLQERIDAAILDGVLAYDQAVKRNGERYKRFIVPGADIAVDLFLADLDNWGNTLAIRTGCADCSQAMVWKARRQGLRQEGGYLWRGEGRLSCRTEHRFFDLLGIQWLRPQERTPEAAQAIYGGVKRWRS
jgi:DNA polymerase/3'-5' exonuclease PolX